MHQATVIRNEPSGEGLVLLTLDRDIPGYERPGQFVTVQVGDLAPAYFALASSPGEPAQLLVKVHGAVAERLAATTPGDAVLVSDPIGQGFALERAAGHPLLLLVNGSAISAARPVIRAEIAAGLPRPVHLYWGVWSLAHVAFPDELAAWERAGVHIVVVVDPGAADATTRAGHVQDAAAEDGLLRGDVALVLVGYNAMIADARARWGEAGVPANRMLVNF